MTLDISRHRELFNPHNFHTPVTIIGAGATGSWLALMLAKLGITDITVWDFDKVEEHNIPNQAYRLVYSTEPSEENKFTGTTSDLNKLKVHALDHLIFNFSGSNIKAMPNKYTNQRLSGIVFLMVDSMAERKRIWEESIKMKPSISLLVEPRMGLDVGRIYNVNPMSLTHIREYEKTYYSDDVAEVSACGASKTVVTTAVGVASWCARQLINFNNSVELDNEILIDFMFNNVITSRWDKVV